MIGKQLDGRYRIVSSLGAGGFGQTFVAEDTKMFDASCVVKVLKPVSKDPQTLELARRLFATEARLLHELGNHDQIPRLFASFEEDGDFYLVQEHIQGHPLSLELLPNGQISEQNIIRLICDILEPLVYVHQRNVIHRDIKPPNLIRRTADSKIVLIDFGSVKQVQNQVVEPSGQTRMTVAIGTYGYMPTEQGVGEPELSSDIYAVGMIALQAMMGIMPDKFTRGANREIDWRDKVSISQELANFIDKMIRYDCRQRYQSATEALEALVNLSTAYSEVPINSVSLNQNLEQATSEQSILESLSYTPTNYSQTIVPEILHETPVYSDNAIEQTIPESSEGNFQSSDENQRESRRVYQHGLFKLQLRDLNSAIDKFSRAIELDPTNLDAYKVREPLLRKIGRYHEAESDSKIIRLLTQKTLDIQIEEAKVNPLQVSSPSNPSVLQNVKNTLTCPIEGPRTLGVTVFGPRGVGKTSLLAAMYDQFGKTTQGTSLQLTAELVTSAILQDYIAKMKSPFDTESELTIVPGLQGTAEPQDFVFDLGRTGGPTAIKLHFKDFPGGRIGVNAHAQEIAEVKVLLESCAVVLVVIDAPALMEDNSRWHDMVNKPMLVTDYFKTAYQSLQSPRLILFVPSKCEKYIQSNSNDLLAKVKEGYAPLINFFKDPALSKHITVAVTPVQTLGNIMLSRIDTQTIDHQIHPCFHYRKIANLYAPKDSDQPLRYLLKFLLKLHLKDRTFLSKAIRSVLGRLFEDAAFKKAVQDFTGQCKTSNGFAVIQDVSKWLDL